MSNTVNEVNAINAISAINAIDKNSANSQIQLRQELAAGPAQGSANTKQGAATLTNLTNEINQTNLLTEISGGIVATNTNPLGISSGVNNNGSSSLLTELAAYGGIIGGVPNQAQNITVTPQPNTIQWEFQGLLDAMFRNASNGTGQLNQSQFANLVNQMDPHATSGVNSALLFSQLDPNGTGLVTQSQFDSTLQNMLSPGTGGGTTVTGAHPLSSSEISAIQYQNTQLLLNTMILNSASNNPNSLLNILT